MQKTKKFWVKVTAATLALAFVPATFAFGGFGAGGNQLNATNKTAIEKALDAGDYAAWKALLPAKAQTRVTETQFKAMVERRATMETHRQTVAAAIASGNYEAWKTEVTKFKPSSPLLTQITAANFAKFSEMHSYREKARAIAEELGIGGKQGEMGMMGQGKFGGKRSGQYGSMRGNANQE